MRRKNKNILFIIVVLLCISLGYAVLNSTLIINGKSNISKNIWDVHFENINVISGSVESEKVPTIENDTTLDFEVMLKLPGDYYEFTVDVVNKGTIDAMINSVVKTPDLTAAQKKYINYEITYQNGQEITTKQVVKSNDYVRINVRVEYKKDLVSSDLPTVAEVLTLGLDINYVQTDESGIEVFGRGITFVDGDINEIGTVVTIGTEKFYTIGTEDNNVKLLSMMNITLEDEPKQSSSAGATIYSKSSASYDGSIAEEYVNKYKIKIEKMGISIVEARLITETELTSEKIGCVVNCKTAPRWIYSTPYWVDSIRDTHYVVSINLDGYFSYTLYCYNLSGQGIRPVIIISKDYFE